MKKRSVAKINLFLQPTKGWKATKITMPDLKEYWLPNQFIKNYNIYTKEMIVDKFILDQKGIKYEAYKTNK